MRSGRAKRKRTILMAVVNFAMPLAKLWIGGSRTILNAKTTTPMDLFDFLDEELNDDIEVELRRKTSRGIPDILIDDRLVLELKVEPKKTERDRLIGQCCDYSVEYMVWAVIIDMPDNKVDELCDLLNRKDLNYIDVIAVDSGDDEEEED